MVDNPRNLLVKKKHLEEEKGKIQRNARKLPRIHLDNTSDALFTNGINVIRSDHSRNN